MNKIFLLVPLTTVVVFTAVYVPYRRSFDQRLMAQRQKERAERENDARQKQAALERPARERAERERQEEAQREERMNAEQRRVEALARDDRLRADLERMCKELEVERVTAALIERKNKPLFEEQDVFAAFVQQTEANRKAFLELLEKSRLP